MQDIGFVHYWWRHDYQAAAEWFDKASKVPGAPWFLRSLAAMTLARRRRSAVVAHHVGGDSGIGGESTGCENDAERRLQQLDAADLIDALQRAIDAAAPRTGKLTDWQDLIRAGVVRRRPDWIQPACRSGSTTKRACTCRHVAALPAAGRTARTHSPQP